MGYSKTDGTFEERVQNSVANESSIFVIAPDLTPYNQRLLQLVIHIADVNYDEREFQESTLEEAWQALNDHIRLRQPDRQEDRLKIPNVKIQQADIVTHTKRLYPKATLQQFVDHQRGPIQGYLGTPPAAWMEKNGGSKINVIKYISHQVRNLRMEEDWLVGDVEIFTNVYGNTLRQQIEMEGMEFEFRLRALGFTKEMPDGTTIVSHLDVIGIDACSPIAT